VEGEQGTRRVIGEEKTHREEAREIEPRRGAIKKKETIRVQRGRKT